MKSKLTSYVKAGFAALYCVTYEEERITKEIIGMAKEIKYNIWSWSVTTGLESGGDKLPNTVDPLKALSAFIEHEPDDDGQPQGKHIPNKSIVILKDFHMFLRGNPPPILIRLLKEAIIIGRASNRHLIILGCVLNLPPELEKEITVIEFSLPTREELNEVLEDIAKAAKVEINGNRDLLLDAGSGLTTTEYADSLAYSKVEVGDLDPGTVSKIKAETIKKNGILEIVTQKVTLDDIGGIDLFKASLYSKRNLFTKAAKEYGIASPRAVLVVGQPGCAKSLSATACGTIFSLPLLRLEAGRLMGGIVGETERNWRTAHATAKAIAPCIVWVDEVDGLMKGAESSGKTDGGTTARLVKNILQDMQFNSDGIFFIFTANDIDGLPDPLIDRCEVWSVELPNQEEREAIWKIHIAKRKRKPKDFDLGWLAEASEGFSGRQIEQVVEGAMIEAFNDNGRQFNDKDCAFILKTFVPTSVTMRDAIEARRKRLANCARPATSTTTTKKAAVSRKIA